MYAGIVALTFIQLLMTAVVIPHSRITLITLIKRGRVEQYTRTMSISPTRWEMISTIAIVVLSAVSALLGLFRAGHYIEPADEILRIYAQDAVILVIGVPVLAIGLLWTIRGSLRGRFVWLGGLAYMAYMWTHYAFVVAYNDFFLGYVALFALSVFTFLSGLVRTDERQIYEALHDDVSVRIYGAFLAVAAVGLGAMWLFEIVPAMLADELPSAIVQLGPEAAHTYVIDLGLLVPSLAIAAGWILQRRPWGYVFTGVLLVFAALIAPTLTAITAVDLTEGIEISLPVLVGTIVPPVIGLVFAGTYLLRVPARSD